MPNRLTMTLLAAALLVPGAVGNTQVTVLHGTSLLGEPKYPAGFGHFDYADPERRRAATYASPPSARSTASTPSSSRAAAPPAWG